ncbi:MAG: TIGR02147 family protein [Fibrobacteria bacterium]|nr:TIGR02147 family protein [Fibrobacteria bacterium]
MHLYEHTDYRAWLKQRTEEIKEGKPFFSYRYIAARLELNAGLVARVLNAQTHLSLKHLDRVCDLYGLEGAHREYFEELVRFGRSRTEKDWERHFARMQSIRGETFRTVSDAQIEYYGSWQHNALRTLLSLVEFRGRNYRRLGSQLIPALDAEETRRSVELLLELRLVQIGPDGVLSVPDRFISTGEKWKASMISAFQKEMIRLSGESIRSVPGDLRDISTLTIPFSRGMMEVARERIRSFRQEMLALARDLEHEDSVYQLNIQFFPLALVREGGDS